MESHRFDGLARRFAGRMSRRGAIAAGAAGALGGLGMREGVAQDATPAAAEGETFYFVQTASSGTFVPNPNAGTPAVSATPTPGGGAQYRLTLEDHTGGTIYFSNRPERIFGDAPTGKFLDGLGFSPKNPPNAAIVTQTDEGEDVAVVELLDPSYDEGSGTLTYGVNVLSDYQGDGLAYVASQQQDDMLPEQFDRASLFIDDCADQVWGCYPRSGADPNGAVGFVTVCRKWAWSCLCCSWTNCTSSDPDSRCNHSGYDCGPQGCVACTSSPIAVATGEGGQCL